MTIDLKYPTTWEEVNRDHLMVLSRLLLKKISREDMLFSLLCKITGIRPLLKPGQDEDTPAAEFHFKKKGKGKFKIAAWVIAKACEELAFMIDTIGLPESPILSVNTRLHEVSFKSYFFADVYIQRYQATNDKQMMFNMYYALTSKRINHLHPVEIQALNIWWCGLKQYLQQLFPEVLKDGENSESDKTPADILHQILSILNKNNPAQNEEILASDVHAVFHALNNIYLEAKKYDNK